MTLEYAVLTPDKDIKTSLATSFWGLHDKVNTPVDAPGKVQKANSGVEPHNISTLKVERVGIMKYWLLFFACNVKDHSSEYFISEELINSKVDVKGIP